MNINALRKCATEKRATFCLFNTLFRATFCVFNTLFRATFVCKVTKLFRLAIMISHNFMCKGYFFWEKPGRFRYPLIIPFEAFLLSVFSIRKPLLRS